MPRHGVVLTGEYHCVAGSRIQAEDQLKIGTASWGIGGDRCTGYWGMEVRTRVARLRPSWVFQTSVERERALVKDDSGSSFRLWFEER